jgi:hypothetical protein
MRSAAGIRTFALALLIGAIAVAIGHEWLLAWPSSALQPSRPPHTCARRSKTPA